MRTRRMIIGLTIGTMLAVAAASSASAVEANSTIIAKALQRVGDTPLGTTDADGTVTAAKVSLTGERTSVARQTSAGAQVLTVLRGDDDQARFTVDMPRGYRLRATANGGAAVIRRSPGLTEMLGYIEAPWAVDAAGKKLATSYRIEGRRLVQDVDTSNAVYPVVADPSFRRGDFKFSWHWYNPASVIVSANKRGSRVISNGGGAVMCIGLAFVPVAGTALAVLCGVSVIVDNVFYEYGYCSRFRFTLVPRRVEHWFYRRGFCT